MSDKQRNERTTGERSFRAQGGRYHDHETNNGQTWREHQQTERNHNRQEYYDLKEGSGKKPMKQSFKKEVKKIEKKVIKKDVKKEVKKELAAEKVKVREPRPEIKMEFGPPPQLGHPIINSDDTIAAVIAIDVSAVCNMVAGFVSYGCSQDGSLGFNSAYAYRFLVDYVVNHVSSAPQLFELHLAPAVFWDVLDAIQERKNSGVSYKFTDPATTINDPTTANIGTVFGSIAVSGDSDGYYAAFPSLGAFTSQLGYNAATYMFANYSEIMDCVKRTDYKPRIRDTDCSAFSTPIETANLTGTLAANLYWKGNGNSYQYCLVGNDLPIECDWLARLRLGSKNSKLQYTVNHVRMTHSAPGAIVVDRMIKKFRGYQHHQRYVKFKYFSLYELMATSTYLVDKVRSMGGVAPFASATLGLTVSDYKIMIGAIGTRHFNQWSAVGIGQRDIAASTGRVLSSGAGNVGERGVNEIRVFEPIGRNLSGIYSYREKDSNCVVYPLLSLSEDFVAANAVNNTLNFRTSGQTLFTTLWNWVTNLSAGGKEVSMYYNANFQTLLNAYNEAMSLLQQFLLIEGEPEPLKINLACVTAVLDGTTNRFFSGYCTNHKVEDHIATELEANLLCYIHLNSSSTDEVQMYYDEAHWETGLGTVRQYVSVQNAMGMKVHVLEGSGDLSKDNGSYGSSRMIVERALEHERKAEAGHDSIGAGDFVDQVATVVKEFGKDVAIDMLRKALLGA